jgi:DNA-binding NarL/FixJ family response regulator
MAAQHRIQHEHGGVIFDNLTPRQHEVLILLAEGLSNQEIANKLHITISTVESHLHAIFSRIGVESRTEAAILAVRAGLVPDDTEDPRNP